MESKQSRRGFLKNMVKAGGACCALLAWNMQLPAEDNPEEKNAQEKKLINLKELSYCGIPCKATCGLYKATLENDVKTKKIYYEKWEFKKNHGIDFDPDKVFCYTCKPGDKPTMIGMDKCMARNCAMAKGIETCVQCKNLAACDKEFWKTWPVLYAATKKTQAKYMEQPGAVLL